MDCEKLCNCKVSFFRNYVSDGWFTGHLSACYDFFFFSACLYNVNITPAMPRYLSLLYIVNGVYQYILFNREGKSKCRLLKMLY